MNKDDEDRANSPMVCLSCAYVWRPRITKPKSCPACKKYFNKGERRMKIEVIETKEAQK